MKWVFVDESGDKSLVLGPQGVTTYFVVAGVICNADNLPQVRATAEELRKQAFGRGEMKSSSVGKNTERRLRILAGIQQLDATAFTLIVNKRELNPESGLQWRNSLYKYLNKVFYARIAEALDHVKIVSDRHGSEAFMEGFRRYLKQTFQHSLFSSHEFVFEDSKEEVMLQVADMIAGSWAHAVDPTKRGPATDDILRVLKSFGVVHAWPPRRLGGVRLTTDAPHLQDDRMVEDLALRRAEDAIEALQDAGCKRRSKTAAV